MSTFEIVFICVWLLLVLFGLFKDRLILSKEERMRIKFENELIDFANETRRIRKTIEKQLKNMQYSV